MSSSSSCCEPVPAGPVDLEALSTWSASPASSTRSRRPRRVMYPASWSCRPRRREASDPACRWLLLLSLLVFLQIYAEETHTCTGEFLHKLTTVSFITFLIDLTKKNLFHSLLSIIPVKFTFKILVLILLSEICVNHKVFSLIKWH